MTKEILKEKICQTIDDNAAMIESLAKDIESDPEYGFKEEKTSKKVADFLKNLSLPTETGLAITGVKARAAGKKNSGNKKISVAILGELDAIGTPDSPKANPLTGAAHTCGHFLQVSAMLAAAKALAQDEILNELCGDVVFFGVPAEEYIEIEYRKRLAQENKLHYLCGKGELIYRGYFDDIDMAMMMHSRDNTPNPCVAVGKSSNGFVTKLVQYVGKSAHAANAPDAGINALNAACLGIMGINSLRETFREQDVVRVHPIITKGGDLVNNIPSDVRLELYVRAATVEAIMREEHKIDRALKAGGDAMGATTIIDTNPGMLPLVCCEELNQLFCENVRHAAPQTEIIDAGHFRASTDMGDVSHIMPAIHPFIGGTDGSLHTKTFTVTDFRAAVLTPAKAFACSIVDLLTDEAKLAQNILQKNKPVYTKEEYIEMLDKIFSKKIFEPTI